MTAIWQLGFTRVVLGLIKGGYRSGQVDPGTFSSILSSSNFFAKCHTKRRVNTCINYQYPKHYLPYKCESVEVVKEYEHIVCLMDSISTHTNGYGDKGATQGIYQKYLKVPTKFVALDSRVEREDLINDWNEITALIAEMGVVPEEADQLSGNIYNISITEDYSSKCFRLSESCDLLTEEELLQILSNIQVWPIHKYDTILSIWKSDATQAILFALDHECSKRIEELKPSNQFKLAILFGRILKIYRAIEKSENKSAFITNIFGIKVLSIADSKYNIFDMSKEDFVLLMSIISIYCLQKINGNTVMIDKHLLTVLELKTYSLFEHMDENELATCYTAMKGLNSLNLKSLEDKIAGRYGFRF